MTFGFLNAVSKIIGNTARMHDNGFIGRLATTLSDFGVFIDLGPADGVIRDHLEMFRAAPREGDAPRGSGDIDE